MKRIAFCGVSDVCVVWWGGDVSVHWAVRGGVSSWTESWVTRWCVCRCDSLVSRWRLCALSCAWRCFVVNWVVSDEVMCVCRCDSLVRRWRLCALSCVWRCFVVNWVESVISRRQRHRRHIMMTYTAPVVTSLIWTLRLLSTSLTSVELSAGCVTTTLRCAWYVCML